MENDMAKSKRRIQTEKFEANYDICGGSLMVWDCISSKGRMSELVFIDGILHKNKYLSILKDNLIKSANIRCGKKVRGVFPVTSNGKNATNFFPCVII